MGNLVTVTFGSGAAAASHFASTVAGQPVMRDLEGIVARTVRSARAQGRDYMAQSRAAAAAVMAVRPDLSFGQALDAVEHLRA
jgi:hypothetical protein